MVRKSFTIDRYCAVYLPPSWIVIYPFAAGILLRENSVMILETARFGVVRMYKILNGYSPNDAACRMIPHSWSAGRIKERRDVLMRPQGCPCMKECPYAWHFAVFHRGP